MIDRRTLTFALAGGLIATPFTTFSQQPTRLPRIGYLVNGSPTPVSTQTEAFRRGLRELGWIEGRTVTIEYRWAEGNLDRLPALVAELTQSQVDVIVLSGTPAMRAAQRGTSTIPIVFVVLTDPVALVS